MNRRDQHEAVDAYRSFASARDSICPHHLKKMALVYVRVSTLSADPTGILQKEQLVEMPHTFGWPSSAITVIADIGRAGSASAPAAGIRGLVRLMQTGAVGIVLCTDFTRLARDPSVLARLILTAEHKNILLFAAGYLESLGPL